jgi:hypothetical protein
MIDKDVEYERHLSDGFLRQIEPHMPPTYTNFSQAVPSHGVNPASNTKGCLYLKGLSLQFWEWAELVLSFKFGGRKWWTL